MRLVKSFGKLAVAVVGAIGCASVFAASCNLTVNPVGFGPYNPLLYSALENDAGFVEIRCRSNIIETVGYSIGLSPGFSGNFTARHMRQVVGVQGPALEYNLYTNASRGTVWGNGAGAPKVGGTLPLPITNVDFSSGPVPIYASIFPRQLNRNGGAYTDSIQVVVSY
jgi:spore coat protein U-like protein